MARMKGIQVEEPTPEVLSEAELRRLLKACEGKEFEDRRDMAVLRLMIDTGLRRFEIAQMTLDGTDLDGHVIRVVGKGGREALAFFGVKTARDLDRYLRVRVHHIHAGLPAFWLAQKGALTGDGIHHLVQRRAKLAGLERKIWPHLFRHSWAHAMKSAGASDEDVMTLGRWRDRKRPWLGRHRVRERGERTYVRSWGRESPFTRGSAPRTVAKIPKVMAR
jgi:site-specific recombinase XerD